MEKIIKDFIKYIKENNVPVEAICLSDKNGLILSEHFAFAKPRNIYSHSKSFTSLLVGIAIDEGKLSLEDRLVDLLKDEVSENDYKRLYEIKLRDVLTMTSGFDADLLFEKERRKGIGLPDYTQFVLSNELKFKPGEKFHYSNGDTYLAARMVEKAYNKSFLLLAYEKLFSKMDIGYPLWEEDCFGHCLAATGLHLSIENMNKLGILCLNKGVYNNQRIVSENWIEQVSKAKKKTDGDDYSYQFWINKDCEGYRADGAYGQLTFIMPKLGYALSIQRNEDEHLNDFYKALKEQVFDRL